MDHWGDPWADNANDKSPTKNAVTSPLPPAFTFAPVPLDGFVDDAGWGNNGEDGFGEWAASDTGHAASIDVVSTPARNADPGSAGWGTTREEEENVSPKWPEPTIDAPQTFEKVDSEPSDSSTVSQLDESASQEEAVKEHVQPQLDLESSVRSSTSPSETSRIDLPIESPRTSVEEERAVNKNELPSEPLNTEAHIDVAVSGTGLSQELPFNPPAEGQGTDVHEAKALEDVDEHAAGAGDTDNALSTVSDDHRPSHTAADPETTPNGSAAAPAAQQHASPDTFVCDDALLAQLFPSDEQTDKQLDEHNDPIFSTSARKAWYRVTRKQTMREFNHGDNDDNYIRVTWTNSHVRAEVHKVVSRWAREDRISGTGPGARASFYWDTPAPAESEAPFGHSRTQSSVPTTKTALPARQSLPPPASNHSASFDWSSSVSPWQLESPSQRSTSTPLAPKNPVVAKLQRQEGRAVSVDLTPRRTKQATHNRTATVSHTAPEANSVITRIPSPIIQPSAEVLSPLTDLDKHQSFPVSTLETADTPIDDDDDWGEMVQTPTLPTPQQLDPFSQPPEPKATPIVRLQSAISPTSALLRANTFVPLNAEHGPIGPGMLKPVNRSIRSHPDKKLEVVVPEMAIAGSSVSTTIPLKEKRRENVEVFPQMRLDQFPSPDSQDPVGHIVTGTPPTPAALLGMHVQGSTDAWADADFSFFESALPTSAPQSVVQKHDPSDPFSFFDTPAPEAVQPLSNSSARTPPRLPTPPLLLPLSGASSSVQRRKAEEDQIIDDILSGLPDLGYMLRQ